MERPLRSPAPDADRLTGDPSRRPLDASAEVLPVVTVWCARLASPGIGAEAAAHDVLIAALLGILLPEEPFDG
jgi:hypothetical protein